MQCRSQLQGASCTKNKEEALESENQMSRLTLDNSQDKATKRFSFNCLISMYTILRALNFKPLLWKIFISLPIHLQLYQGYFRKNTKPMSYISTIYQDSCTPEKNFLILPYYNGWSVPCKETIGIYEYLSSSSSHI